MTIPIIPRGARPSSGPPGVDRWLEVIIGADRVVELRAVLTTIAEPDPAVR